jgi:putative redox protein
MSGFLVHYKGQLRTECTHNQSQSQIQTDAPVDNQGKGERFSPTDLVATSLASCMMTIMGILAIREGIDGKLQDTIANVEKIMNPSPRKIAEIIITFQFHQEFTAEEKLKLERAARTCPVALSLHPDIKQTVHFQFH